MFRRARIFSALVFGTAGTLLCGCPKATTPRPTLGVSIDESSASFYSFDDRALYRLRLDDGKELLEAEVQPPMLAALVRDGIAYGFEVQEGSATQGLVAFDPGTKARKWVAQIPNTPPIHWVTAAYVFVGRQLLDCAAGQVLLEYPRIVPTASDEMVLVCDDGGRALAANPKNKSVYWQTGRCVDQIASSGKKGARIFKTDVTLFELTTGREVWASPLEKPVDAHAPAGARLLAMDGDRVYVASSNEVSARAAADGHVVWKAEAAGELLTAPGVVAVVSKFEVVVLDAESGKRRFVAKVDGDERAGLRAAVAPGKLIVRTNKRVSAFNLTNGELLWSRGIDG